MISAWSSQFLGLSEDHLLDVRIKCKFGSVGLAFEDHLFVNMPFHWKHHEFPENKKKYRNEPFDHKHQGQQKKVAPKKKDSEDFDVNSAAVWAGNLATLHIFGVKVADLKLDWIRKTPRHPNDGLLAIRFWAWMMSFKDVSCEIPN